jgi:hypothetical protein
MGLNNFLYPNVDTLGETDVMECVSFTLGSFIQSLRSCCQCDIFQRILSDSGEFKEIFDGTLSFDKFLVLLRKSLTVDGVVPKLNLLYSIHNEIVSSPHFDYNFNCTALIINTLYKYLDTADEHHKTVWNVFLDVLRPTLKYLEEMLDVGSANDPREEFMFDVNDVDILNDKDFWNSCLSIREIEPDTTDNYSIPIVLKPVLEELMMGIKSRLLLKACSNHLALDPVGCTRVKSKPLWISFYERFNHIQGSYQSFNGSSSDSGNVSEANSHEVVTATEVAATDSGIKTGENEECETRDSTSGDISVSVLDEGCELHTSGQLCGLEELRFSNLTALDSHYFKTEERQSSTYQFNPDFESLPSCQDDRLNLSANMKYCLKSGLHEALYSVLIDKCSETSSLLVSTFLEMFLKQLKFHTDYMLLLKTSHSISLYLDNLFEQITFPDSLFYKRINLEMYHFDDTADVRACIIYSTSEMNDPIKVLARLHIFYEDLDPFSRLLIDSQTKQVFGDAFYFLLLLKYSKWILDSVKLKTFLPKKDQEFKDRRQLKMKHQLFCLRFKCMRSVVGLLEYAMLQLQSSVHTVIDSIKKAKDFNKLKKSLESFSHSVKQITLQDKKNVIQLIASTSVSLHQLCMQEDNCQTKEQELKDVQKHLIQIEAISNLFVDRMTHSDF